MARTDIVAIGESLGLIVPERVGRLAHSPRAMLGFGGAESNVAIGASRLGATAAWIGRVGADGIGDLITRELRAEGVQVHAVVDEDAATAVMVKERPRPGASRVTYYRSVQAGSRLSPNDLPADVIETARILHVTGISAGLSAAALAAIHAAIDRARAAGVLVSFDVNHRGALWRNSDRDAADEYRRLAARADIIFAGDDEAEFLTGETDQDAQMNAMLAFGATTVIVKLGDRGAVAAEGSERSVGTAIRVDVVDTVGAGDAFVAGWLAETARGAALDDRMNIAIACGAFACTGQGDWESAPSRADLASFLANDTDPVQR